MTKKKIQNIDKIRETFSNYFDSKIQLPEKILQKGYMEDEDNFGWIIQYVFGKDENGETCLDFTAEHRMTNPRHCRIKLNGELIHLESYQEGFSFNSNIAGDEEAKRQAYYEYNQKIAQLLKDKGLE